MNLLLQELITRRMAIANETFVSFCNAHFGLPWDNRGKCHMDEKGFNACQTHRSMSVPINLQPFTSYSELLVGNCNFFSYPLHLMPPLGLSPLEFR